MLEWVSEWVSIKVVNKFVIDWINVCVSEGLSGLVSKGVIEFVSDWVWVSGFMIRFISEWVSEWVSKWVSEQMNKKVSKWISKWVNE